MIDKDYVSICLTEIRNKKLGREALMKKVADLMGLLKEQVDINKDLDPFYPSDTNIEVLRDIKPLISIGGGTSFGVIIDKKWITRNELFKNDRVNILVMK